MIVRNHPPRRVICNDTVPMMDKQTRLSKLAAIISDSASEIDSFLVSRHLPNLTFDADGSSKALLDTDLATPRQALLEATDELHALLLGPVGLLTTRAVGCRHMHWQNT